MISPAVKSDSSVSSNNSSSTKAAVVGDDGTGAGGSSNAHYRMLRLLRSVENRLCADCNAPLMMSTASSLSGTPPPHQQQQQQQQAMTTTIANTTGCMVVASLKFKVWICGDCATAHNSALSVPFFDELPAPPPAVVKPSTAAVVITASSTTSAATRTPSAATVSPPPPPKSAEVTSGGIFQLSRSALFPASPSDGKNSSNSSSNSNNSSSSGSKNQVSSLPYMKRRSDTSWTELEVAAMESAVSNLKVNKTLERFLTPDWPKPNRNSSLSDRLLWVRAKYYSCYFSIPQLQLLLQDTRLSRNLLSKKSRFKAAQMLPMRAVDYFVTLTAGALLPEPKLTLRQKQQQQQQQQQQQPKQPQQQQQRVLEECSFSVRIADQFPAPAYYGYTRSADSVPQLITAVVFPGGLKLSTEEKRPFCFTFVVTNENQVKMYGTALVVYEMMEPAAVQALLSNNNSNNNNNNSSSNSSNNSNGVRLQPGKVYYAPKAMVLLSHYPFYNLCSKFLAQLYRLSLSQSPLPVERYVANFILELPLPPQGRVEVLFTLPGSLLQLSRPPRNRLPMVDFSYLPLFTFLSSSSILAVFNCLCQELTVCILSSNLALLTPVQEALLSFLFPLVWQGCYVPVLPQNLLELLQAPVPLLVGVHCQSISEVVNLSELPSSDSSVLYVHLDTDTLHFGPQCRPLPLPKHDGSKLRKKLIESSGSIHRDAGHMAWMNTAGDIYPNDEHLQPMKRFMHEQGVLSRMPVAINNISNINSSINNKSGSSIRKGSSSQRSASAAAAATAVATAARHPAACTLEAVASGALEDNTEDNQLNRNPLDPLYNCGPRVAIDPGDYSDKYSATSGTTAASVSSAVSTASKLRNFSFGGGGSKSNGTGSGGGNSSRDSIAAFDAAEIRDAFLRFFVASFAGYHDFFRCGSSNNSSGSKQRKRTASHIAQSATTVDSTGDATDTNITGTAGASAERATFLQDEYLAANDDPFMKQLICSQMFANFVSERIDAPQQSEIVFFDEQILAKKNRSKFALSKSSTPFLSDTSEHISSSFAVPGPLTANIATGQQFHYPMFPVLDKKELQLVIQTRRLTGVDSDDSSNGRSSATGTSIGNSNSSSNGGGEWHNPTSLLMREFGPEQQRVQLGESIEEIQQRLRRYLKNQTAAANATTGTSAAAAAAASIGSVDKRLSDAATAQEEATTASAITASTTTAVTGEDGDGVDEFFSAAHDRYTRFLRGIIAAQSIFRARPLRLLFLRAVAAAAVIRRLFFAAKLRYEITCRQYFKYAVQLQHWARGFLYQQRYKRLRSAVIRLQSLLRQRKQRLKFLVLKRFARTIQSTVRGFLTRQLQLQNMRQQLLLRRRQLLLLWFAANTPLKWRSLFWFTLNNAALIDLALHEAELRRLYDFFGFYETAAVAATAATAVQNRNTTSSNNSSGGATGNEQQQQLFRLNPKSAFENQFAAVENCFLVLRLRALHSDSSLSAQELAMKCNDCVTTVLVFQQQQRLAVVNLLRGELFAERQLLYAAMKHDPALTQKQRDGVFTLFGVLGEKRRKHRICEELLWSNCDVRHSNQSAQALFAICFCHHSESSYNPSAGLLPQQQQQQQDKSSYRMRYLGGERPDLQLLPAEALEWVRSIRSARILRNCADIARGCIKAIQEEY